MNTVYRFNLGFYGWSIHLLKTIFPSYISTLVVTPVNMDTDSKQKVMEQKRNLLSCLTLNPRSPKMSLSPTGAHQAWQAAA